MVPGNSKRVTADVSDHHGGFMGKRVLIAMSGGVDSSIAAYLMLTKGYDCAGVTMRQFRNGDIGWQGESSCCSWRDMEDAAKVAYRLGIPHTVLDFTREFRRDVIDRFVQVYETGGTPNPCIDCNRCMRAGHLMAYARKMGFDYIATGHYARILQDKESGRYLLMRGLDRSKDQAYVHYSMSQEQLAHTIFPLGELRKADVRQIANDLGFINARKPDSQDICFVPDGDYGAFLERYTGKTYPPGDFLDLDGHVIGRHAGAVRYTIGQRRGLGLSAEQRLYVIAKDVKKNAVIVGPEQALYVKSLIVEKVNWIAFEKIDVPVLATVQTRYRQQAQPATVVPLENSAVRVDFVKPQRSAAPGQAAVFYDGDTVLGGGTILGAVP